MFLFISQKIISLIIIKFIIIKCILCNGEKSSLPGNLKNCGGEFSGYQYSISSPNYPENYPENRDCVYNLRGSPLAKCDQIFNLHFLDFQLRNSEDCTDDFIEIGERNLFCGNVVGIKRYSGKYNNSLIVRFHSGGGSEKGFKILVTTLPCSVPSVVPISNETLERKENEDIKQYWSTHRNHDKESLTESPIYPVYRPETAFTIEENFQPNQEQIPQKLEVLNNGKFQLPIYTNKLYKSENNSVKRLSSLSRPAKISAYLFTPPDFDDTKSSSSVSNNNINLDIISSPPSEFLLPTEGGSPIEFTNQSQLPKISNFQTETRTNEKLVIPASSYGVPSGSTYSNIDTQIKTGEVLENADCEGKANINTYIPMSTNFREGFPLTDNYPSGIFNPFGMSYPATTYGTPGLQTPQFPIVNSAINPSSPAKTYGPPLTHQSGHFPVLNDRRPGDFRPSSIIGNIFPGSGPIVPNINAFGQCCQSLYSSQRFLIVSPGFPSLIYSGNNYQCSYTIAPYSPNVCRLRLHFKFFNHGADDQFCRYGYLEIDGRRYCGCRTGLTFISNLANRPTINISVRYMGYPQTKLNGFLIEVFQETCSYNGYPYLSRSKKHINSTLLPSEFTEMFADINSNTSIVLSRDKRQLGYDYSKPKIPFDEVGGQLFHSGGIGQVGFTSVTKCQASSIIDWVLAAKEIYLKNAKCVRTEGNGGVIPGSTGNWIPNYPSNGNINPGLPVNGNGPPIYPNPGNSPGNVHPVFPGSGNGYPGSGNSPGNNFPGYPASGSIPGNFFPVYPGAVNGPGNSFPGYPGFVNPASNNLPGQPIPPPTSGGYLPGGGNEVVPGGTCETISVPEGLVSSPGYPNPYPNGIQICYRFYRPPDSCQLQLSILDFDVEASPGCIKDYLVIGYQNTRYCGRTLAGSKTLVDFPRSNIIDIRLFTDAYGSGRGFNIGFNQAPCPLIANR